MLYRPCSPSYRRQLLDLERRRAALGHAGGGGAIVRRGGCCDGGLGAEPRVQARLFGRRRAAAALHPSRGG